MEKNSKSTLEEITKEIESLWKDKLPYNKRKVHMGSGKGGVVLQWQWMQEEFGGKKPTDKEIQDYSDSLIDGHYVMDGLRTKGPTMSDTDKPDGQYLMNRWAREDGDGNKIGEKWTIESWSGGYGVVDKYITEEEYNEMRIGLESITEEEE